MAGSVALARTPASCGRHAPERRGRELQIGHDHAVRTPPLAHSGSALALGLARLSSCTAKRGFVHGSNPAHVTEATAHRELGAWILSHELALLKDDATEAAAAEQACRRFYGRLRPLVTLPGSQAFLSRSLHLAAREHPFLVNVRAGSSEEECLQGLDHALNDIDPASAAAAFITVLSHMIALLVTFIGHDLTMHAIREVWPDACTSRPAEGEML